MEITVKFFAIYRERSGNGEIKLVLPEGSTVGFLTNEIVRLYPNITRRPSALVVAVNDEYKDHEYILAIGDEVALIPPVSGGTL